MRSLRQLDGAAFLGEVQVADLRISLPSVLWASPTPAFEPPGLGEGGTRLSELPSPGPLQRAIRLEQGSARLDLNFSVPTPEVTGGEDPGYVLAPRVLAVRTPISESARRRLSEEPWDLVVWANARAALTSSERFVRQAVEMRESVGPAAALWAPRVALPGRLAFLFSLGLDLVDTTEGLWSASGPSWSYAEHEGLEEPPEDLPAAGEGASSVARRASFAQAEFHRELVRARRALRAGRLRELVEARVVPEPVRGEWLRYFDRIGYAFQEQHTPVVATGVRPYTTKEALRRPEVERFRRRFLQRYHPPPSKRVLLLLPCSKTKPYARSPSHRRVARALDGLPGLARLHVVSATSPLGLVPRDLECVFPARHYDIPVTGEWDEDERRWVREALQHLQRTGPYVGTIAHLGHEEYGWLSDLLPASPTTAWSVVEEETTSARSLAQLRETVASLLEGPRHEPLPGGVLRVVREELRALAVFQFGAPLADRLFAGEVRLSGRPWFQRLVSPEKVDLATWREEVGLWRLTVPGARRVADAAAGSRVELRGGVELRGDLFAPGVLSADPEVRVGDDVLLLRQGQVLGVGEARVPGPWMGRLPRGLVVKVRHRAHDPEPTAVSSTEPASTEIDD